MDYLGKTGRLIEDCGFYIHPEYEWLGATPDGLIGDDGLSEIKCPFGLRNDDPPKIKTAEEQQHYYAQMQIEMACAWREWVHFYQWTPKGDSLETVYKDQAWLDENIPKLRRFYDEFLIERDNPEHLEPLRKVITGDKAAQLILEYGECEEQISKLSDRKKEILAELVDVAGGKNADIYGKKLTKVNRKGSVEYSKIPELKGVDLDQWRKKSSTHWRLS